MRGTRRARLVSDGSRKEPSRYFLSNAMIATTMAIAVASICFAWEQTSVKGTGRATASMPKALIGRATVIDGDTVAIHGEHVRINGIDALETRQACRNRLGTSWRCGKAAAEALDGFLSASSPLRCEYIDRDRYGRFVGNCVRAGGKDVAAWLVSNGHALDWPLYSNGTYANEQAEAEAAKTGIWSGTFEAPWDWRAVRRNPAAASERSGTKPPGLVASTNCRIKGNINGEGAQIYHVPG